MTTSDATLYNTDDGSIIVYDRLTDDLIDIDKVYSTTDLSLLASFDHGLCTADETAFVVGCEIAAQILTGLYTFLGHISLRSMAFTHVDYPEAIQSCGIPYSGEGWAESADSSQELYEWRYEMEQAASSAGLIVESSSDAGMTWIYIPVADRSN